MKQETSYGIIPLQHEKHEWKVLLIQHGAGHWSFPKGHPEAKETPQQTAARELEEETGLQVACFLSETPLEETYYFRFKGMLIHKTVVYYLAKVKGKIVLQTQEISDAKWVPLKEAANFVTYPAAKNLCQRILENL